MPERYVEGTWPKDCLQRAFVAGAKWWEFVSTGGTMWASDRGKAEAEAIRRYGEPAVPVRGPVPYSITEAGRAALAGGSK